MLDLRLFASILFGNKPRFPNLRDEEHEYLYPDGLTMGTLILGRQGTGKTSMLARQIVNHFLQNPDEAVFVLDSSGSLTDNILTLIAQQPPSISERLLKRVVYDAPGDPDYVVPLPEFSEKYGAIEEQVARVVKNLKKSNKELVERTPVVGGLAIENAAHFFRLCSAITNEHGETWQITEVKKLLVDLALLRDAVRRFGYKVPEAKYFIEKTFMEKRDSDKQLSVYALISILGAIEAREVRARLGFYEPGWTPAEAIQKGLMVILNGAGLTNQKEAQNYLFTQVYSLIMQEINKRTPGNPYDKPVSLVLDEVYSLLSIPGMAEEIGMVSPLYRNRKLILYVVLQTLAQLAKPLDQQIWALGNKIIFALENKVEAEGVAHQLFQYDPRYEKQPARSPNQNPITEPEHGLDRLIADWIQHLNFRECLQRRFISERELDPFVIRVKKTKDYPTAPLTESMADLKYRLLKERAVKVRDALEVINNRTLKTEKSSPPTI